MQRWTRFVRQQVLAGDNSEIGLGKDIVKRVIVHFKIS